MKYEAKDGGASTAASTAAGVPMFNVTRATAATYCTNAGAHLITNDEWMTIARNIEANPVNWNNGTGPVGTGTLSRGNSDSATATAALAASTDNDPNNGVIAGWTFRRTHVLSNSEVIWDLAGNLDEWVADDISGASQSPSLNIGVLIEYSDVSYFAGSSNTGNRKLFSPNGNFDTTQNVGGCYGGNGGAMIRGGAWNYDNSAGVFHAGVDVVAPWASGTIGFRCAAQIQ